MHKKLGNLIERVRKPLVNIITILAVIGVVFSTVRNVGIMYIVKSNTELLKEDSTAISVDYIDSEDNIYLENSSVIFSDTVENYVKVLKGTGTWYIDKDKCMAVEVVGKDIITMIKPLIFYGISLLMCFLLYKIYFPNIFSRKKYVLFGVIGFLTIVSILVPVVYFNL